jgi:predicted RNA binding protein YcfA (HicA-like mRNA interferase family)
MKYRDLIREIESEGWFFSRNGKGGHKIYKHPTRKGSVVISGGGKLNRDVPTGTLANVRRQAAQP